MNTNEKECDDLICPWCEGIAKQISKIDYVCSECEFPFTLSDESQ